jgi:hypothetical protein
MRNLVLVSFCIGLFLLLGCTPRRYEVKTKTKTTATTVVEKTYELLVSWDELTVCDTVVDKSERLGCYDRLLDKVRLAKIVDEKRYSTYEGIEKAVQDKYCAVSVELGRDSSEFCPKAALGEPVPIVMDVSFCEFCSRVEHLVRGVEHPEQYPQGWQLKIPKGRLVLQLLINGEMVAEMAEPFSHYVIEVVEGPLDASGKRSIIVDYQRVGEYNKCSTDPTKID